jgi:hypothetical protein
MSSLPKKDDFKGEPEDPQYIYCQTQVILSLLVAVALLCLGNRSCLPSAVAGARRSIGTLDHRGERRRRPSCALRSSSLAYSLV